MILCLPRFIVVIGMLVSAQAVIGQINYLEVAIPRGIDHNASTAGVGGGVSFVDFDNDGDDDITLATEEGIPLSFYENTAGQFSLIAPLVNNIENVKQILWVDMDNDGDMDLYLNAYGGVNRLYVNTGGMNMQEITSSSGLSMDEDQSYGAIWADFNRDGWVDLYTQERRMQTSGLANINRLYLNNANNTFEEITTISNCADEGRIPFCSGTIDYNDDKWPDIYIANDRKSRNTLLKNNGDETFTDVSINTSSDIEMDAMSVTVGDYDRDGDQDIYITNIEDGNVLLQNLGPIGEAGETIFNDVALDSGVEFNAIGWGANWLDGDLDGDLDLYVSGSLEGTTILSSAFYENDGLGEFVIPTNNGFDKDTVISYNNAIGDYNNDGLVDIIVFNNPPYKAHLWENRTITSSNWIKIKLQGVKSNRDAIGAKMDIYTNGQYQMRYIHCGHGFIGQNSFTEIIGLGAVIQADSVIVTWPTGHIDRFYSLGGNQLHLLVEGSSTGGEIDIDDDVTIVSVSTKAPILETDLVQIYPNPAQNIITLESDLPIIGVEIYNRIGQLMSKISRPGPSIDLSNLLPGVYIAKIRLEEGIVVRRIVKLP